MDKWILSFTQSLIKYVRQEMQGETSSCSFTFYAPALKDGEHIVLMMSVCPKLNVKT